MNPADIDRVYLGTHSTIIGYDFCGQGVLGTSGLRVQQGEYCGRTYAFRFGTTDKTWHTPKTLLCLKGVVPEVPPILPESHADRLTVVEMTAFNAVCN